MKLHPMQVVHLDLSVTRDAPRSDGRPMLAVLWWGDLPLSTMAGSAEETPFSTATLNTQLARFAAEQRATRDPALGAPLQGSYEGHPDRVLTLAAASNSRDTIDWLDRISSLPTINAEQLAVIVCTRDRGEALSICLNRLLDQARPPGELIVVDNSSDGNALPVCSAFAGIRYVHEPEPGLSRARNAGIRAATCELIAFTDDDVEPHKLWTSEVVRAFEHERIDAMAGLVLPSRLETPPQVFFQMRMGAFGNRFVPVRYDDRFYQKTRDRAMPVWRIGAGANMAFRKTVFEKYGLFDPRLGAGASGCSEDSELWYRIIAGGGTCQYEPRAVVYHDHRDTWPALHQQMRAYQKGHVSALVVQADAFGDRGNLRRIYRQLPGYLLKELLAAFQAGERERLRVLWEQFLGWGTGLPYLLKRKWRRDTPHMPSNG